MTSYFSPCVRHTPAVLRLVAHRNLITPDSSQCVIDTGSTAVTYYYQLRNNQPAVVFFSGRKRKPDYHISFKSDFSRDWSVALFFETNRAREGRQVERPFRIQINLSLSQY